MQMNNMVATMEPVQEPTIAEVQRETYELLCKTKDMLLFFQGRILGIGEPLAQEEKGESYIDFVKATRSLAHDVNRITNDISERFGVVDG